MAASVKSPFTCGGSAQSLPILVRGGKVIIRCDDDDPANRLVINIGRAAAADDAIFYLNTGEAVEISCSQIPDGPIGISVLNVGNDPNVYWGLI